MCLCVTILESHLSSCIVSCSIWKDHGSSNSSVWWYWSSTFLYERSQTLLFLFVCKLTDFKILCLSDRAFCVGIAPTQKEWSFSQEIWTSVIFSTERETMYELRVHDCTAPAILKECEQNYEIVLENRTFRQWSRYSCQSHTSWIRWRKGPKQNTHIHIIT